MLHEHAIQNLHKPLQHKNDENENSRCYNFSPYVEPSTLNAKIAWYYNISLMFISKKKNTDWGCLRTGWWLWCLVIGGSKYEGAAANCVTRSFVVFPSDETLFGWPHVRGFNARLIWNVRRRSEMHTGSSVENLRKRDHLENLGVDGMVIFRDNLRVTYSKTLVYTQLLSMVQSLPQKSIKDTTFLVDNNIYSG